MIQYRLATVQEIDILVTLRIKELAMFSDVPFPDEGKQNIKFFYEEKMRDDTCYTLLGYDKDRLVATGTIYFCHCLPSNANATGVTGYITNIWTHDNYRRQGIATQVMEQLLDIADTRCGLVCLNASTEGEPLYIKKGFTKNEKAMFLRCRN